MGIPEGEDKPKAKKKAHGNEDVKESSGSQTNTETSADQTGSATPESTDPFSY